MANPTPSPLDEDAAWALISALRARLRTGPWPADAGVRLDGGTLHEVAAEDAWIVLRPDAPRHWAWPARGPSVDEAHRSAVTRLLDLYVPLCVGPGAERMVAAHLAQSLDGRIATTNGESQFISGTEDLQHTHRLRSLFDAVVVGASTVEHDDPQLTTRLCPGEHPVRVVIDPLGRIGTDYRLVREGPSPTLLVRHAGQAHGTLPDHVEVLPVAGGETEDKWLPIADILAALRARGLSRVFIEGGGITVSRFLEAGQLDRLQVSISPLIIGSGRPAFSLPEVLDLEGALPLQARTFAMGRDILFDCPLAPRA